MEMRQVGVGGVGEDGGMGRGERESMCVRVKYGRKENEEGVGILKQE